MAKRVQFIGNTTTNTNLFDGRDREITVDTTLVELALHTGAGAGTHKRIPNKDTNDVLYQTKTTLLTNIAALTATDGLIAKTAAGTVALRTITGTANQITLANGGGAGGNPTVSLPAAITIPGTLTATAGNVQIGTIQIGALTATGLSSLGTTQVSTITSTGVVSDLVGNIRNVPKSGAAKTANYGLVVGDIGQYIELGASGAITIPDATFAAGNAVSVFNNTSSAATITCTITTAYISGTDADKATMSLASRGIATILFLSGTVCVVSGAVS